MNIYRLINPYTPMLDDCRQCVFKLFCRDAYVLSEPDESPEETHRMFPVGKRVAVTEDSIGQCVVNNRAVGRISNDDTWGTIVWLKEDKWNEDQGEKMSDDKETKEDSNWTRTGNLRWNRRIVNRETTGSVAAYIDSVLQEEWSHFIYYPEGNPVNDGKTEWRDVPTVIAENEQESGGKTASRADERIELLEEALSKYEAAFVAIEAQMKIKPEIFYGSWKRQMEDLLGDARSTSARYKKNK